MAQHHRYFVNGIATVALNLISLAVLTASAVAPKAALQGQNR